MLVARGRLSIGQPIATWIGQHLAGYTLHPLSIAIAVESNMPPPPVHGDPSDRIIVATARILGGAVATADGKILEYGRAGHVRTIDAGV